MSGDRMVTYSAVCAHCCSAFTKTRRASRKDSLYCSPRCAGIATFKKKDFWELVKRGASDECWPWLGAVRGVTGYGAHTVNYRSVNAHRFAYELSKGPIAEGLVVRHSCDNRVCCNPSHLSLGTQKENIADMMSRGRHVSQRKNAQGI